MIGILKTIKNQQGRCMLLVMVLTAARADQINTAPRSVGRSSSAIVLNTLVNIHFLPPSSVTSVVLRFGAKKKGDVDDYLGIAVRLTLLSEEGGRRRDV